MGGNRVELQPRGYYTGVCDVYGLAFVKPLWMILKRIRVVCRFDGRCDALIRSGSDVEKWE